MERLHTYHTQLIWTGNKGTGTSGYTAYEREHTIQVKGKPPLQASSDPSFRGDRTRYNPEELFVSSLSSCHMLWYLHLCSEAGVVVTGYEDDAEGYMQERKDGSGYFTEVILKPRVTVSAADMIPRANELHDQAHRMCFIANSCNFPIRHQPTCTAG